MWRTTASLDQHCAWRSFSGYGSNGCDSVREAVVLTNELQDSAEALFEALVQAAWNILDTDLERWCQGGFKFYDEYWVAN